MLDQDWLKAFAAFGSIQHPNLWLPMGACVFISYEEIVWCVTAAHILNDAKDKSVGCLVEVSGQQTILNLTEIQSKTPNIRWIIDQASDLAACPMPLPNGINIRSVGFDRCLEQKDLLPSMPCLTAGQPYGLPGVDRTKPTPLILDGVIAGIDAENGRVFVSVPTFPGNSGGPIIAYRMPWSTGGGMNVGRQIVFLAGVITRTILLKNEQDDKNHRSDKNFMPPLHLGMGATVDNIKKLLTSDNALQILQTIKAMITITK
ncbi:MAG: hypothetical protein JW841_00550 [Deltaproteobacteria bacterium]|nr:hypothetical protein [Deltaproteobacteria bacterium]